MTTDGGRDAADEPSAPLPPGHQIFEVRNFHDQDGRFIQVQQMVDDAEDLYPAAKRATLGPRPTTYIGHGQFMGRRPDGSAHPAQIRFPIEAQSLVEAFERMEEAFDTAVAAAQAEQSRVVIAGSAGRDPGPGRLTKMFGGDLLGGGNGGPGA